MRNWQFSWFQQKGVLQYGANVAYDKKIHRWGIKIPSKCREMMGLAVAAALQCSYCEILYRGAARMHGETNEELAEVV
ncbi:MAG: carboxymuconolactone decarboxylase family protein [Nitrososphaeraceae archaeon]